MASSERIETPGADALIGTRRRGRRFGIMLSWAAELSLGGGINVAAPRGGLHTISFIPEGDDFRPRCRTCGWSGVPGGPMNAAEQLLHHTDGVK